MIRKDLIIDKAHNHLAEFLGPIGAQTDSVLYQLLHTFGYTRISHEHGNAEAVSTSTTLV